jgi:hypothetical protein
MRRVFSGVLIGKTKYRNSRVIAPIGALRAEADLAIDLTDA